MNFWIRRTELRFNEKSLPENFCPSMSHNMGTLKVLKILSLSSGWKWKREKMLTMSHFKQRYFAKTPWASRTASLRSPTSKANTSTGQWPPTIAILATYCGEMPQGSALKMALGQALSLSAKLSVVVNRPRLPMRTTAWPMDPRHRGWV